MNDLIDTVAAAIAGDTWAAMDERDRHGVRQAARRALLAMREPTPAMLREACSAMSPGKRPTQERVSSREKHRIRYTAMIDEALK